MYPVSQAYINKLKDISRKTRAIRGTVDNVAFTENDILENSFSYTLIAVKSADIKLGGVFIGKMEMTFLDSFVQRITRGSWKDRVITCEVGLDVGGGTFEYVPIQPFTIDEANHSALGVDVVAYDPMVKFVKTINLNSSVGTMFGFLTMACNNCGVLLGMTEAEINALPNGTETITLNSDNDIETWQDLLSYIGVAAGGFVTINRQGRLVIRNWHSTPDLTIGVNDRFEGGSWSDFKTKYTAITIPNISDGEVMRYAMSTDDGMDMDIGANPLLQAELDTTRDRQRMNVLNSLVNLQYVPFKSTSLIDPAIDLGDVILYSDGIADDALCCVMRIDFSFSKGATLQGYGKNPAMQNVRSLNDKRIAQASNKANDNGLTYYSFSNADEITINDYEQTTLIDVEFATTAMTTVMMMHQIKMLNHLVDNTQTVTLFFYHGDDLIAYRPANTYSEDDCYHFFPSFYTLLNVAGGTTQRWRVKAQTSSGTAFIDIGDVEATLVGQKMVASDAWLGTIKIDDEYTPLQAGAKIVSLTEDMGEVKNPDLKRGEPTGKYLLLETGDPLELEQGGNIILEGGNV